jgi:hypothetical protein
MNPYRSDSSLAESKFTWRTDFWDLPLLGGLSLSFCCHLSVVITAFIMGSGLDISLRLSPRSVPRSTMHVSVSQNPTTLPGNGTLEQQSDSPALHRRIDPEIQAAFLTQIEQERLDQRAYGAGVPAENDWPDETVPLPRNQWSFRGSNAHGNPGLRSGERLGALENGNVPRDLMPNRGGASADSDILAHLGLDTNEHRTGQTRKDARLGDPSSRAPNLSGVPCGREQCEGKVYGTESEIRCPARQIIRQTSLHFGGAKEQWDAVKQDTRATAGRIVLKWRIGSGGRAIAPRILKDTVGHPAIRAWVLGKAQSLFYAPAPAKGCKVIWHVGFGVNLRSLRETLGQIARRMLADQLISHPELMELKTLIYDDTLVSGREMGFLMELHKGSSNTLNDPHWPSFFIKAYKDREKNWRPRVPLEDRDSPRFFEEDDDGIVPA